jgi:hypothetical protein
MQKNKAAGLFILFLLSTAFIELKAQETVPAAGSNASGTGGTVSYTVGQVEYTRISASSGSMAQGIQLPYEIFVVTAVSPSREISLTCAAYPNPAAGVVNLKVANIRSENISYALTDSQGKLLETKTIRGPETSIQLSQYPDAVFFLTVYEQDKKTETFRIIHKGISKNLSFENC